MRTVAKIPLLILSFMLSVILWVYVQVQENPPKKPKTSYTLQVEPLYLPDSLVASAPDPITIFPRGPQDELARIDENKLKAIVDLSKAHPDGNGRPQLFPVRIEMADDYNVRWDPAQPQVQLIIQRKITKVVQVKVQQSGELANRDYLFLPQSTYTDPMTISISGPESDVEKVRWARAILDLTHAAPGGSYTSLVDLVQDQDRPAASTIEYEPKQVIIRPAIAVGAESRTLHVMPTYKGAPPPGYVVKSIEVTPPDVQVRGRPDALEGMTFIRTTEPPIDLSGLKQTTTVTRAVAPGRFDVIVSPPILVTVKIVIEPERLALTTKPTTKSVQPIKKQAGR